MVAGGFLAVRGAEGLLDVFGLGESTIGLTVLAFATSCGDAGPGVVRRPARI